jgi:hypothetical protein
MGGGITFGSTKVDDGCTIRLLARQLFAFGFQKAALALMCEDDRVAIAMEEAGSSCPVRPVEISAVVQNRAQSSIQEPTQRTVDTPAQEPTQRSFDISTLQVSSNSQEERVWFDRASSMN